MNGAISTAFLEFLSVGFRSARMLLGLWTAFWSAKLVTSVGIGGTKPTFGYGVIVNDGAVDTCRHNGSRANILQLFSAGMETVTVQ